jgi:hypothetical protein
MLQKDSKGKPADKYAVLADSLDFGNERQVPGLRKTLPSTATESLTNMFAKAAQGVMSTFLLDRAWIRLPPG